LVDHQIVYRRPDQGRARPARLFRKSVEGFDLRIVHVDQGSHHALRLR
jgi:hypothetical protein